MTLLMDSLRDVGGLKQCSGEPPQTQIFSPASFFPWKCISFHAYFNLCCTLFWIAVFPRSVHSSMTSLMVRVYTNTQENTALSGKYFLFSARPTPSGIPTCRVTKLLEAWGIQVNQLTLNVNINVCKCINMCICVYISLEACYILQNACGDNKQVRKLFLSLCEGAPESGKSQILFIQFQWRIFGWQALLKNPQLRHMINTHSSF